MRALFFILISLLLPGAFGADLFVPYFDAPGVTTGNGLLNGLLAFWRFEGGQTDLTELDSSSAHRDLTAHGNPISVPGIVLNARGYNNSSQGDYFSRADDPEFSFFPGGQGTITAWASFNYANQPATGDMTIISSGDWQGPAFRWWLIKDYGTPNDSIFFYYSTTGVFDSGSFVQFDFKRQINGVTGFWFIALRWNGARLSISATQSTAATLEADQFADFAGPFYHGGGSALYVGQPGVIGGPGWDMDGSIDEVGIWSVYLSDCQLRYLFSAGKTPFTFSYSFFDAKTCTP